MEKLELIEGCNELRDLSGSRWRIFLYTSKDNQRENGQCDSAPHLGGGLKSANAISAALLENGIWLTKTARFDERSFITYHLVQPISVKPSQCPTIFD